MRIIDLLNKIANGEEVPREFTYKGYLWEYDVTSKTWFYHFGENKNHRFDRLFYINQILNDEVEIIEEHKIPEKLDQTLNRLDMNEDYYKYIMENRFKINEIIDYLEVNNDRKR